MLGIIAEFNPLHSGHIEHIIASKKITGQDITIVVMSGNFVQRGEPAIYDKFMRTKMALEAGVDMVIELPLPFVLGGAECFARGAVTVLAGTGVVTSLSFGTETDDLETIKKIATLLHTEPPTFTSALRTALQQGKSYAAARGIAISACLPHVPEELIKKPNNTLAIEYCRAALGTDIKLFNTWRQPGGPSATRLRKEIIKLRQTDVQPVCLDDFSDIFKYAVAVGSFTLPDELHNSFKNAAGRYTQLSDILMAVKSKRYTLTRLQREAFKIILGVQAVPTSAEYIRILGFRRESANVLGMMAKKATLPIITRDIKNALTATLELEIRAGDVYRIASKTPGGHRGEIGSGMVIV